MSKTKQKTFNELDTEAIAVFEHRLDIFENHIGLPAEIAIPLAESTVRREDVIKLLADGCPPDLLVDILA